MIAEKEIINALNILKKVCEESNKCCSKCILRNGYGFCGVMSNSQGECYDTLQDWELRNYENPRLILY